MAGMVGTGRLGGRGMRHILLALSLLLSLSTTAAASAPEAELLVQAANDVNASAVALNAGTTTIEEQVHVTADILTAIGPVEDYSDPCVPLAYYVTLLAESWHQGLAAIVAEDTPAIRGNLSVAAALFAYYSLGDSLVAVIIDDCLNGL